MFTENLASYDYIDSDIYTATAVQISVFPLMSSSVPIKMDVLALAVGLGCWMVVLETYFYGVCRPYLDSSLSIELSQRLELFHNIFQSLIFVSKFFIRSKIKVPQHDN